jgi:hypothetical protein
MARKAPKGKKLVETLTHDESRRSNIPTAAYQSVLEKEAQEPVRVAYERRNKDLDPQLVWKGTDVSGLERPGRARAAALHPGKGAPHGPDRRPAEANARAARGGSRTGPIA